MSTRYDTIDPNLLADAIERYLDAGETQTNLASESRVPARTIYAVRQRDRQISIDIADRLCLAMQIPLEDVAPLEQTTGELRDGWCSSCREYVGVGRDRACPWCEKTVPVGKKRGTSNPDKALKCITPELLAVAYQVYGRGLSVRRVAELVWPRTTYASPTSCKEGLFGAWRTRGWKCRPQRQVTIERNFKHGRSTRAQAALRPGDTGYEEYRQYRRDQLRASGAVRDVKCSAVSVAGVPCARFALTGKEHCVAHDPERAAERRAVLEAAWARSRARMLRWGDHAQAVRDTIEVHGRPALCRASGVSTTVIGRMLKYDDDQPIKPETWAKLARGIEQLAGEREAVAS